MARTLRDLLLQRAARLQDRPALTAPGWGTLTYTQLRARAEGVAFGLLAGAPPLAVRAATATAWDWAAELAAAGSGLPWDPDASPLPAEVLGGATFHAEAGRGPYHAREDAVSEATPFTAGLAQGEVLRRLARLNERLGWDHETTVELPLERLGEPALRAALWSAFYGGSHAVLRAGAPWDPAPFESFWS